MYILFDIGATRMRFSRTIDDKYNHFSDIAIYETPPSFKEAMSEIRGIIKKMSNGDDVIGVVGGIAGVLNSKKTTLDRSPNIPDWEGKPLKTSLMDITGSEVYIFNDADLSGLGEAVFGAGKDKNIVMYITASTGFGGGLIINKEIVSHHVGFEPGWQIIDDNNYTSLHDFIAGHQLEMKYNMPAKDIEDPEVWKCVFDKMTIGLHNSIVHWSPEKVIMGGSLMHRFDIKDIENRVAELMKIFPSVPEFEMSELGGLNGLYGCLAFIKKKNNLI